MNVQLSSPGTSSKIKRYEKVISTFVKYGFEDIVSHPPFSRLFPQTNILVPSRQGKKVSQFTRNERIRLLCEELGTTFIKFAQIASNRPDLLPEDLIDELTKLQDAAPVVPVEEIYEILNAELLRPIDELVEYFDEKPLASASMAQVHRARLIGGKEVVLKIQRPGIRKLIATDVSIFKSLVAIIETYFPQFKAYNPAELVKMFEVSISKELSFRAETNNLKEFKRLFRKHPEVYVPEHYGELCTDKVICMEFIDGYKITDLETLSKFGISGKELAIRGIGLYFEQVFEHGFFHADPHPGNIFVLEDGRVVFIDYGMMGIVLEEDKLNFANLLLSMYKKDHEGLKQTILKYSDGLSKEKQLELEYDINDFLRDYTNISIENIDGNEVMKGLNALFFDYKIRIPSHVLLLLKALVIIEGVGLKIDPEYDIIANIGPYVQRLLLQKYNHKYLATEVSKSMISSLQLVKGLPSDIKEIVQKIKEGKLHIEIEHTGLSDSVKKYEIIANRISFSLIVVAFIIASSICTIAKIPPLIYNIPILGFAGLIISFLLALRLLYSIDRHGRI